MQSLPKTGLAAALVMLPGMGLAQEADTTPLNADIGFIFTTFMFLVSGFLVFFMAAGFAMLEAGLVRGKNVAMQLTKNVALFSLASLFYYILGYNLMYPGDGWSIDGMLGAFSVTSLEPVGLEGADPDLTYASVGSDFFFQLMFCAATASIVSGALAERIKLWPFLVFTFILTAVIYPIQASWKWGGGFLDTQFGFQDFAGSTVVHSVGGWAALAGAIVLGSRLGQVQGRQSPANARFEPAAGNAWHVHPVARLVWVQRRVATCDGFARRHCRCEPDLRQHEHSGSRPVPSLL